MTAGPDLESILVATDGSASAYEAIEVALDLAQDAGADVTLVHVLPAGTELGETAEAQLEQDAALQRGLELARSHDVEPELALRAGDVVEEVGIVADTVDADIVVVGSRGLGEAERAVLGSVSRALLAGLARPVLVIRAGREHVHA